MQISEERPYILLNGGSKTRQDFTSGLNGKPCLSYRTKEMLLHIQPDGTPRFLYHNNVIDLRGTYVFIRLRATDTHFCGMIAEYLAHHHVPTNDPIHLSYPYSAEKISQMLLLAQNGIRIPETHVFREEAFEANKEYLRTHLTFPLVYKLDGSKGKNVELLHSFEELESRMKTKRPHKLALIQPFVENTFDTRTLVFMNEVLGSISRTRTTGYLNNIAQGAHAALFSLSDIEKQTALDAAKACRIDFAGVDMIHTPDGPIVLEVNKSPQVGGFESVHNFKVFSRLAEHIQRLHP